MTGPPPLPLAEAQARLLAQAEPLGHERVAAGNSVGRYLGKDLVAQRNQPAADMSAMDGYAVHDSAERAWRVIGESAAGKPFAGTLGPGEAVRISTGALLPAGAAAVLLQEQALHHDGTHHLVQRSRVGFIDRARFDAQLLQRGADLAHRELLVAHLAKHGVRAGGGALRERPRRLRENSAQAEQQGELVADEKVARGGEVHGRWRRYRCGMAVRMPLL